MPCRGAVNIVFRYADCQIALRGQASHDPVQVLAKNRLSFPVRAAQPHMVADRIPHTPKAELPVRADDCCTVFGSPHRERVVGCGS